MSNNLAPSIPSKQWASTYIQTTSNTFEWTIQNFSLQSTTTGEPLVSPTFHSQTNHAQSWKIQLFLDGGGYYEEDYIGVALESSEYPPGQPKINAHFEIWISNPKNATKMSGFSCRRELKNQSFINALINPHFVSRAEIKESQDDYLVNDTMTICCEIKTESVKSLESKTIPMFREAEENAKANQVSDHLRVFFKNERLSDVTIIAGNQKYPCHKVILSAQSAIFFDMFVNKTTIENEIEIKDLLPETVQEMLYYIYTGEVKSESSHFHLLMAAEKYQLKKLKAICEYMLLQKLSVNNAAETLMFADIYNAKDVKKYVIDYICAHENTVGKTSGFERVLKEVPAVVAEIYQARLNNVGVETFPDPLEEEEEEELGEEEEEEDDNPGMVSRGGRFM